MNRIDSTSRRMKGGTIGLVVVATAALVVGYRQYDKWRAVQEQHRLLAELPVHRVERGTVRATLSSAGKTDSAEKTLIECELQQLGLVSEGRSIFNAGGATLLTVIPDGSWVKKGDVLATFDAAEYEEFVRLQEIKTKRAQSDLFQAKLNLESAQMALHEFKDGLMRQNIEAMDGGIALAQTDIARWKDRLAWSERMLKKGYVAADQVSQNRQNLRRAELDLVKATWAKRLFEEFGAPQRLKILAADIETKRFMLINETVRSERFEERLELYKEMVAKCTIRAPQDGMIIYANNVDRDYKIEAGVTMRQGQDLFYLPDLTKMQVRAELHESIAPKVSAGMRVHARIEALNNLELAGKVLKVDPLPFTPSFITQNKFFAATIELENAPRSIRPDMSAHVVVDLGEHENVLTIPSEAIRHEGLRTYCYVVDGEEIERREVRLGMGDAERLEVIDGLELGEHVLAETDRATVLAGLIHDGPSLEERRRSEGSLAQNLRDKGPDGEPAAPATLTVGTAEQTGL